MQYLADVTILAFCSHLLMQLFAVLPILAFCSHFFIYRRGAYTVAMQGFLDNYAKYLKLVVQGNAAHLRLGYKRDLSGRPLDDMDTPLNI